MGLKDNFSGSMRIMLPEHVQALAEHQFEKTLEPQPVVDQDELATMSLVLYDSVKRKYDVTVRWWQPVKGNLGRNKMASGRVESLDNVHRQIKLALGPKNFCWIPVENIVSVEK